MYAFICCLLLIGAELFAGYCFLVEKLFLPHPLSFHTTAVVRKDNGCGKNKIEKLLIEMIEHPTTGTGQVEALKGNLSGYWSRRIDKFNRIIYTVEEEVVTVTIISTKGHYGDK